MLRRKFIFITGGSILVSLFGQSVSKSKFKYRLKNIEKKLKDHFKLKSGEMFMVADPAYQRMYLIKNGNILKEYIISTSKYGLGSESGSNKTPVGTHRIKEKFGKGAPIGRIFRGRVDTGETAKIYSDDTDIEKDDVTTRIMWLDGVEKGVNRGGNMDSHRRYIYIHGTPEEGLLGKPASHGCIRMKNSDVIELFNLVKSGTLVEILTQPYKK